MYDRSYSANARQHATKNTTSSESQHHLIYDYTINSHLNKPLSATASSTETTINLTQSKKWKGRKGKHGIIIIIPPNTRLRLRLSTHGQHLGKASDVARSHGRLRCALLLRHAHQADPGEPDEEG